MNNILKKLVWPVILAPAIYLALIWKRIPETITMHFDLDGNPDQYGNKKELITVSLILILTNAFIYLLVSNVYRIDPKKYAAENKDRLVKIAFAIALFMSAILFMVLNSSLRNQVNFRVSLILSGVGLLFAFIGNYLPNLKPNYFAGLRLPWTLENEENWKKTHLLAGKLWFGGGLVLAITCLFLSGKMAFICFFIVMTLLTVIPCVYSYRLYKQQKSGVR